MKRRTIITAALVGAALTVGLILYLCARLDNSHVTVTSTGPLDIRLWGIRPDAGDTIYDPNGKKIMDTLGVAEGGMTVRKSDLCRHDFVFETPATDEPVFHDKLQYLVDGSRFGPVDFAQRTFHFEHKGRTLWWFQTTISRTAIRSLPFGIWRRRVPVDRIDLNLQYYCGPPRKPICMFKGPFEVGKTVVDETGLYRIFLMEYGSSTPPVLDLHVYGKPRIDPAARALFYAAEGKRHVVAKGWSPADPNSPAIRYRFSNLSPEDIELITIGEEPFEIAVRNLNLDSLKGEHRTYAEHLDKIAERLDLERDPKRLERYRFGSIEEILKVIDVIRGDKIPDVCQSLCISSEGKSRLERANLSTEQLQRLRQTVLRWAGAIDPEIRAAAAKLGLHCGWPEFVDVALDLVEYPDRHRSRAVGPAGDATAGLSSFKDQLSETDVERIAEIIPRHTDSRIINGLRNCLKHRKSPARVTAMWDLAASEHPWLWCPAITQLSTWGELDGKHDSLPKELKIRVFLKLGPSGFSDPNQIAPKASDLLLSLLSSELLTHHHSAYASLLLNVPENIDRRVMTDVMIESLRNTEYGPQGYSFSVAIGRIVKHLNQWYDVDIGGLNSDVKKRDARLYRKYMDTVASEAVRWYDTVYTGAGPNALQ